MPQRPDGGSPAYRWYVLTILVLVYMMHHLDRVVFSLLQEPIKDEFQLSDAQLALVSGTVFAIAFGIAGLPLGYLADRTRRVTLLSSIVATWSGLTALASMAMNFTHLLLLRVVIGAAESGSTPTNISILSDYFKDKRSTAIGIYMMGAQLGTLVGFALTGFVAANFGWRAALLAAGVPGLFLVILLMLTIREPLRQAENKPGSFTAGFREIADDALVLTLRLGLLSGLLVDLREREHQDVLGGRWRRRLEVLLADLDGFLRLSRRRLGLESGDRGDAARDGAHSRRRHLRGHGPGQGAGVRP